METRYDGTIGNDKITVEGKVASNDIIAYKTIFGGNFLAKISGNQILHAPNGDWSKQFPSDRIDYVTSGGQRYVAKFENGRFRHAPNGDFTQAHPSKYLDYKDWSGNSHFIALDQNQFSQGHADKISLIDGKDGNDTIHVYGGGHTILGGNGDDILQETSLPNSSDNTFDGGAGNDTVLGGAGNDQIKGGTGNDSLIGDAESSHIFAPAIPAHPGFDHSDGWSSYNKYPRQLADVNGDGRADIVGFGSGNIVVALGQEDGSFSSGKNVGDSFTHRHGWSSYDKYPRQLADVNGDGRADIIGFGHKNTVVALGQEDGTFAGGSVINDFSVDYTWSSFNQAPRHVADVNGDGRADIVGFHPTTIRVALGQADGSFSPGKNVGNSFTQVHGWNSQNRYPRQLADVNGDGRADIIGFGAEGVAVALGQMDGSFGTPIAASQEFSANHWASFERSPRQVADVDGDGRADIIGFGEDAVLVAFGKEDGTFTQSVYATNQYQPEGERSGWYSFDGFPRQVADVNGDGLADIVGFGATGVSVALSQGKTQLPSEAGNDQLRGGWGHDTLKGGGGNDTLLGEQNNDTLEGGEGNDILDGGTGYNLLDGGTGQDTASYTDASSHEDGSSGVNADLSQGTTVGRYRRDTLKNIENLNGSNHDDTLTGDENTNSLQGNAGDDHIIGGKTGHDTLDGGSGNDRLDVVAGTQSLEKSLKGGAGSDQFVVGVEGDVSFGLELNARRLADFINDITLPNQGVEGGRLASNILLGGLQAARSFIPTDTGAGQVGQFAFGWFTSAIKSGVNFGFDKFQINKQKKAADAAVQKYGNTGWGTVTKTNRDLITIEDFTIGEDNILLPGLEKNSTYKYQVVGGPGGAFIKVKDGTNEPTDILFLKNQYTGANGLTDAKFRDLVLDIFNPESGVISNFSKTPIQEDGGTVSGSFAWDNIIGKNTNQTMLGGFGDDVISGNGGDDLLYGGTKSTQGETFNPQIAKLYTHGGNDILDGGVGHDTLFGETGHDNLIGGAGDDRLMGGEHNDTLIGGLGADTFVFNSLHEGVDQIQDFSAAQGDRIELTPSIVLGSSPLDKLRFTYFNTSTGELSFNDKHIATIENVATSGFSPLEHLIIV